MEYILKDLEGNRALRVMLDNAPSEDEALRLLGEALPDDPRWEKEFLLKQGSNQVRHFSKIAPTQEESEQLLGVITPEQGGTFRPGFFDPIKDVYGKAVGSLQRNVAEPLKEGLFDAFVAPARVSNIAIGGIEKITGLDLPKFQPELARDYLASKGVLPPEDEVAQGFIPRSLRILSGAVLPGGALMTRAARIQQLERTGAVPLASTGQRGVVDTLAMAASKNPGLNLAIDTGASFAAGFGGEVAEALGAGQQGQLVAELLFGILTPLAVLSRTSIATAGGVGFKSLGKRTAAKALQKTVRESVVPADQIPREALIKRAADRVKSKLGFNVTDEFAAQRLANQKLGDVALGEVASKIDVGSKLPPAIQTGNERLIAIQNYMLKGADDLESRYRKLVNAALVEMETDLTIGAGGRTREILQQRSDHIGQIMDDAISLSATRMKAKFDELGSNLTPRKVTQIARDELDTVYSALKKTEKKAWRAVDQDAAGSFGRSRVALAKITKEESPILVEKLSKRILVRIKKMKEPKFKDIHALRGSVDDEISSLMRGDKPGRNVVRVYQKLRDSLTDDMADAAPEATNAISISRELNIRFRDGPIGRLYTRNIAGGDTLQTILNSRTPITNYKAFIAANPDAKPRIEEFLRAQYDRQVLKGGEFNKQRHSAFVRKLEDNGLSDEFPELMSNVDDASYLSGRMAQLRGRKQTASESRNSAVNTYLDADVGHEMAAILTSKNPAIKARNIYNKVRRDKEAVEGLHAAFNQEMFNAARQVLPNGEWTLNGMRMTRLIKENIATAKALGMDDAARTRLRMTAKIISQATNPESVAENVVESTALLTKFGVTLLGAKFGAAVAQGGAGSSIKMAAEGASMFNRLVTKFTKGTAVSVLQDAQLDSVLYREMLMADVTKAKALTRAVKLSEDWIAGAVTQAIDENAITRNEEDILQIPIIDGRPIID